MLKAGEVKITRGGGTNKTVGGVIGLMGLITGCGSFTGKQRKVQRFGDKLETLSLVTVGY